MANDFPTEREIAQAEHIGPAHTGDNVDAKKTAPYGFSTAGSWARMPTPLIDAAFDYIGFTDPDGNDNYQIWTFKNGGSSGTTVRTLTWTFDASSNPTSVTRS